MKEENMKQIIIQFGGTGDLAKKKLIPAYYELFKKEYHFEIIFLGRRFETEEDFFAEMIGIDDAGFRKICGYINYDMNEETDNIKLLQKLQGMQKQHGGIECLYYMALSPYLYEKAVEGISKINTYLGTDIPKKVIVEKPFGFDCRSAAMYNEVLKRVFRDEEIFRVDHYLGKEFIQNLLILRFQNDIIHGIWNKDFIDHVQIIIDEKTGVDQRLEYYEKTGVIRDMVQNHILQILTSLTMEEPVEYTQEELSKEKIKVLKSVLPITDFALGRYAGLPDPEGGERGSPTFIAFKVFLANYTFSDVPFYIRTGKKLPNSQSVIYIQFKSFRSGLRRQHDDIPNAMIIEIQPHMKIDLYINVKRPGEVNEVDSAKLNFDHFETFKINTPEAYEQILQKILENDAILFPCEDEIRYSWKIVDPLIEKARAAEMEGYEEGTVPPGGAALIENDGRCWHGLCTQD
jgi:glucose-6-phosphate 1-dehydrogenase